LIYETFFYVAPSLFCEKCLLDIPLPYPGLPQTNHDQWCGQEYKSPMDSVPDGWSIVFGCRECGHVDTYSEDWVGDSLVEKETQGVFHNETNCFSVRLQCARVNCKAPATLHVNLGDGETEKDLLKLLKANFFGGLLPCGHQLMPIPDRYYVDPRRILTRLW
jgi:hypothetical protein